MIYSNAVLGSLPESIRPNTSMAVLVHMAPKTSNAHVAPKAVHRIGRLSEGERPMLLPVYPPLPGGAD